MKANKKGISLIVLIITIVVIIILAAAIILNLRDTNIIENANDAVTANNVDEMQSAVSLKIADIFAEKRSQPTLEEVTTGYPVDADEKEIVGIYTTYPDFEENYTIDANFDVEAKAE